MGPSREHALRFSFSFIYFAQLKNIIQRSEREKNPEDLFEATLIKNLKSN